MANLNQAPTKGAETIAGKAQTLVMLNGYKVLPCKSTPGNKKTDKTPACDNGFLDATGDLDTVARQFANPLAALIGVRTGEASGIVVLDVDPDKGGDIWLRENEHRIPLTEMHATRRVGGQHFIFKSVPGLSCSADGIAPGVDIRANSGYAIWWPAHNLHAEYHPIAEMPHWLVAEAFAAAAKKHDGDAAPKAPEELAPPSAKVVRDLITTTPNPTGATRDDYVQFNLAVQGCIRGGEALEIIDGEQAEAIKDAAAAWAARWESSTASSFEDERAKWSTDWETRTNDTAGWRQLVHLAHGLGADTTQIMAEQAASEFSAVPLPAEQPAPPGAAVAAKPALSPLYMDEADPYSDRSWLVYGMLPDRGVALMAGASGVGKSFAALDLALSVGAGTDYAGQSTDRPGGVLYIAGENSSQIPVRWRGTKAVRGMAGTPVPFVWTDTDVLQKISQATGALVVGVDHHGKNIAAGARGASAKHANADAVLTLMGEQDSNGVWSDRRMIIAKNKAGPEGQVLPFDLVGLPLGADSRGRQQTTATVVWVDRPRPAGPTLSDQQADTVRILRELGGTQDEGAFVEICMDRKVSDSPTERGQRDGIKRHLRALRKFGLIGRSGGKVQLLAGR